MAKNLIYQYWKVADGSRLGTHGNELPYTERVCIPLVKKYAERIGADYRFDADPSFAVASDKWSTWVSKYYNCFEPCFNPEVYQDYDNILYVDCDIGIPFFINDNIFEDQGQYFDIAICREREQEWTRRKQSIDGLSKEYNRFRANTPDSLREVHYYSDEKWIELVEKALNTKIRRNEHGLKKLYNSGVVLYTQHGMQKARDKWLPFEEYLDVVEPMRPTDYYLADQEYLNAMIHKSDMVVQEMSEDWNARVCNYGPLYDCRTPTSKFIHVQVEMGCQKCQEQKMRTILSEQRPYDPWRDLNVLLPIMGLTEHET